MIYQLKNPSTLQRVRLSSMAVMLCTILFMPASCEKENDHILLTVSDTPSYTVQFGENPSEVEISAFMVVMEAGSSEEQKINLFAIERFTYEKGYEYLLKVKKMHNNDDCQYSLLEIVSKTLMSEETVLLLDVSTELLQGDPPIERIIVKEEDSPLWQGTSFKIEGLVYENGFDFRLRVKKTIIAVPPQTGFTRFTLYNLVEIISKTSKTQ